MRRSRSFQPAAVALESRVVLSQMSLTAAMVRATSPSVPGAPAPGNGADRFPMSISRTLQAGLPVYEQSSIRYSNDPTVQTIDELIVPDTARGITTTTEWINLKDNGGIEKVVDVKTVAGTTTTDHVTTTLPNGTVKKEVEVAVNTIGSTTHTNTTTLPDGTIQISTYTDEFLTNHKTQIINGSQPSPSGGIETYTGTNIRVGNKSFTHHTYILPDGLIEKTHSVVVSRGDSGQFETFRTQIPSFKPSSYATRTTISRFTPPAS